MNIGSGFSKICFGGDDPPRAILPSIEHDEFVTKEFFAKEAMKIRHSLHLTFPVF